MTPYLTIHAAADQTAMLALSTAVRGDAAVRADTSAVYILTVTGGHATAANWKRLVGMASLVAAASAAAAAAVMAASLDIDGERWQGRKYDSTQEREFPRVAYGDLGSEISNLRTQNSALSTSTIWDWDSDASEAIVPERVFLAVLHQADAILKGRRAKKQEDQHEGIVGQGAGGLNETFDGHGPRALCYEAAKVMSVYRLRTGRML